MSEQVWITTREAAKRSSISVRTLQRHMREGSLPAYRVGPQRVVIRIADLEAFLAREPVCPVSAETATATAR